MRKIFRCLAVAVALVGFSQPAMAQFDLGGALKGAAKTYQALTLSDEQVAAYAKESIAYMDSQNVVCGPKDPYTIRLSKLTAGLTQADGVPLNFKVYKTTDVNAFACPDGSVRVFSGIMDMMDDNELLGIIGHEIGHVALHHSKKQLKQELMNGALRDVLSAGNGVVAALSASQLGAIGESLMNARYSRKQETQADDAGYDFLKSNGKNPWGMVSAFQKMSQLEQQSGVRNDYLTKMFSDHPDTQKRIKHMTERCKKDKISIPAK